MSMGMRRMKVDKLGSKVCLSLAPISFWQTVAPRHDE